MLDNSDQANEPLARRLQNAAIERTANDAERVDDFVIDEDGVLDLRELDRDPSGASVADPAKALATIRGQLGDAHEVSDLYDESEPARPRWRLGLRARHAFGDAVPSAPAKPKDLDDPAPPAASVLPPLSRLSMVPLAAETPAPPVPDAAETAADDDETDAADTGLLPAGSMAESIEPEIDLRDQGRPTADCPKCMGLAHRDLFDRFSQVEFYSCDNCMHMWQQDLS